MASVEHLTATLVLLLDAAKPSHKELAQALVAALDDRSKVTHLTSEMDELVGVFYVAGVESNSVLEHLDDMDEAYIGQPETLRQLCQAEASRITLGDWWGTVHEEFCDEMRQLLKNEGLIMPKPELAKEASPDE